MKAVLYERYLNAETDTERVLRLCAYLRYDISLCEKGLKCAK